LTIAPAAEDEDRSPTMASGAGDQGERVGLMVISPRLLTHHLLCGLAMLRPSTSSASAGRTRDERRMAAKDD